MTKTACVHEVLHADASGKVLICRDCGVVHLHLPHLSLHFEVGQFAAFAALTATAAGKLNHAAGQHQPALPKRMH